MSTGEIIFAVITSFIALGSLSVAIITVSYSKSRNVKRDAVELGTVQSDLGYIKSGVDDLKQITRRQDDKLEILTERLAKVEATQEAHINNKSLHSRGSKTVSAN